MVIGLLSTSKRHGLPCLVIGISRIAAGVVTAGLHFILAGDQGQTGPRAAYRCGKGRSLSPTLTGVPRQRARCSGSARPAYSTTLWAITFSRYRGSVARPTFAPSVNADAANSSES